MFMVLLAKTIRKHCWEESNLESFLCLNAKEETIQGNMDSFSSTTN